MTRNELGFYVLRPKGGSQFVIFCDHASNPIPPELHDLGLTASELTRLIGWDIRGSWRNRRMRTLDAGWGVAWKTMGRTQGQHQLTLRRHRHRHHENDGLRQHRTVQRPFHRRKLPRNL
jgi:hypothetical protein